MMKTMNSLASEDRQPGITPQRPDSRLSEAGPALPVAPELAREEPGVFSVPDPTRKPRTSFGDPLILLPRLLTKLYSWWVSTTYPFASIGRSLSMHHTAIINRRLASRIKLGNSVILRKDAWLNVLPESDEQLKIVIDDGCVISGRS